MNIRDHGRFILVLALDLFVVLAVLFAGRISRLICAPDENLNSVVNADEQQPTNSHAGLVFILTTGFEDIREVEQCLYDVKVAKASGYLGNVTLIVRGHGVDALTDSNVRPLQIANLARDAKVSGVRIIASKNELDQASAPSAQMDPVPTEIVPDAATTMAKLVSKGYQILHY
jgi:hypothetical protein